MMERWWILADKILVSQLHSTAIVMKLRVPSICAFLINLQDNLMQLHFHFLFFTGVVVDHISNIRRSHVFQSSLNPRRVTNAGVLIFGFL